MFKEEEKVAVWLSSYNKISVKKYYALLELYPDAKSLYANFEKDSNKITKLIDKTAYEYLKEAKKSDLKNYLQNLEKSDIKVVTYYSEGYPETLKQTSQPPLVLYCRGDISLLNSNCLSIVGTRRSSRYGRDITEKFAKALSDAGLTIVSGLADGIDSVAHKSVLEVGGKTIAVLGSGLNEVYPATNRPLAAKIIEQGGLVISEYKPNEKPQTYYFPYRNRIIAGLSAGVLITEATEKSGSMHTKEYACEYGKEIYVVPGRIDDIYSKGCNEIIKTCQGCMVTSPADILETLHIEYSEKPSKGIQATMEEEVILNILEDGEKHLEELLDKTSFEVKKLNTLLTRMELMGMIKKLTGNYYSK